MEKSDAERAARERFGDVDDIQSEVARLATDRHARQLRVEWIDALHHDVRLAIRTLRAKPAYATALMLTLALGIGANLAIFTVVNSVLLRPLPLREPERLVRVYDDLKGAGAGDVGLSVPELEDLTTRAGVFDEVSATFPASAALAGGDRVERVELLATSPNYFELLQATAAHGRVYGHTEWKPGFLGTVVISDALWRRQFGADVDIIGKTIRLDEDPYTIMGVMPPDFRHPGTTLSGDVDVWGGAGFSGDPFPVSAHARAHPARRDRAPQARRDARAGARATRCVRGRAPARISQRLSRRRSDGRCASSPCNRRSPATCARRSSFCSARSAFSC